MKLRATLFFAAALGGVAAVVAPAATAAAEPNSQITILYDAFGTDSTAMEGGPGLLRARGGRR